MPFRVIPALDLKEGRCVTLVGGDPGRRIVELDDPAGAAKKWEACGASFLHMIDLDGAIDGMPSNMAIVRDIVEALEIPVQFGGGVRTLRAAREILGSGVWRIILGTLAIAEPQAVEALSSEFGPSRIMVALDFKGQQVVTHGWTSSTGLNPVSAAKRFEELGAGSVLHTNVDVEGRLRGIPLDPIRELVGAVGMEVIASGGISSIADLLSVRSTGAAGAIIGAAIYTGRIDLEQAIGEAETG
jgi:phosphoribosylformimino-5-aminoimidazole carboxamide ribotide isomerase